MCLFMHEREREAKSDRDRDIDRDGERRTKEKAIKGILAIFGKIWIQIMLHIDYVVSSILISWTS